MKDCFNKIDIDKIKNFCLDKKRYIGAVGLFIIFVLILAFMAKPVESNGSTNGTEITGNVAENFQFDKDYAVDKDAAMSELLNSYYTAYASDDLETLEQVARPISNNEKSYIGVLSQYYESIQNMKYYSKAGLTEGSYFVSVYNEIKFYGVDTLAPTLDFFYVETDDEGKLYINNLYSIFNLSFAENTMDSDVYAVVQKYMQQEDFASLQQDVQAKYNEALTADANLANMIQSTLDGAIKQWAASINAMQESTEDGTEVEPTTEAPVEDTNTDETTVDDENTDDGNVDDGNVDDGTVDDGNSEETADDNQNAEETDQSDAESEETTAEEETPSTWTVQTTDGVNIRGSASTDGTKLGRCDMGTRFTAVGTEGDWTKVEYREQIGYIKTEFLETVN